MQNSKLSDEKRQNKTKSRNSPGLSSLDVEDGTVSGSMSLVTTSGILRLPDSLTSAELLSNHIVVDPRRGPYGRVCPGPYRRVGHCRECGLPTAHKGATSARVTLRRVGNASNTEQG